MGMKVEELFPAERQTKDTENFKLLGSRGRLKLLADYDAQDVFFKLKSGNEAPIDLSLSDATWLLVQLTKWLEHNDDKNAFGEARKREDGTWELI